MDAPTVLPVRMRDDGAGDMEALLIITPDPGLVVEALLDIPTRIRRQHPVPVVWVGGDEPVQFDSADEAIAKLI
jgi:hypothetical protein